MSNPKLNPKEESSAKKTRSPPKKAKVEQSVPKKKKLKTDAEKTAEKAQHLRFGKAELTPDELSRLSKAQKREMYAAHTARSAVHRTTEAAIKKKVRAFSQICTKAARLGRRLFRRTRRTRPVSLKTRNARTAAP